MVVGKGACDVSTGFRVTFQALVGTSLALLYPTSEYLSVYFLRKNKRRLV